jgi:DNA-binding response OmpR family regulator
MCVAPPILLVDDDLALAQAMIAAIENTGIPVEHCTTGEVAIELVKKKRYAVVIVDLILEHGISGIYVVNAVRNLAAERRPVVLMITGANLENLRGVDRATVSAVMLKPIDFALFADFVLAAYRHSTQLMPSNIEADVPKIHTYCGSCGNEIAPWIFEPPEPANRGDTFQLWLDTPCPQCGVVPREAGGRSDWTPEH